MSGRFAISGYAQRLSDEKRDVFAQFACRVPADAVMAFLRGAEGVKGALPACPKTGRRRRR